MDTKAPGLALQGEDARKLNMRLCYKSKDQKPMKANYVLTKYIRYYLHHQLPSSTPTDYLYHLLITQQLQNIETSYRTCYHIFLPCLQPCTLFGHVTHFRSISRCNNRRFVFDASLLTSQSSINYGLTS